MQIAPNFERKDISIEEILKEIKKISGAVEKKVIVFEAIGLAMADNNYDNTERKFINSIISEFDIEEDFGEKCEEVIKDYFRIQNVLNSIVLG